MNSIKSQIIKSVSKLSGFSNIELERLLETPPDKKLGDLSLPCFEIARLYKKNPAIYAQEIATKIKKPQAVSQIKVVGPYINFYIDKTLLAKQVLTKTKKSTINLGKSKKVIVEFSSPNTNKPQHLGHLRNNLLGQSISNILKKTNHKVIKTSIVNDRGTHICKSMLAYLLWGHNKKPNKKPDHFVGDFYVMFESNVKKDPTLEQKAKDLLLKWENKDKNTIELWKKMNSWVYKGFKETYSNLNIKFDKTYYESDIYKQGKKTIYHGLKKGQLVKKDGAIVADLTPYNLPERVLIRSNGTSLYITQDIYLALLRLKEINPQKIIYVVANEQELHFKQLFAILDLLGYKKQAKKLYHLSYGYISLPEGRMKSRQGTVVDIDTLLQDVAALAKFELQKRQKNIQKATLDKKARIIALSAIRVFFLKYDPYTDFVFNPESSISFEGETGPYVLYTYARINSILKKENKKAKKINYGLLSTQEEADLITHLANIEDVIIKASKELNPSIIIRYLVQLCQKTNEFYQKHQVLKAKEDLKFARIALLHKIKQTLKETMDLLNIEHLEKM